MKKRSISTRPLIQKIMLLVPPVELEPATSGNNPAKPHFFYLDDKAPFA